MMKASAPPPLRPAPPGAWKHPPPRAAECVIGDCTIETFSQDRTGPLGCNAYRMRSAEAMGTHGCLVVVASSLLHLTCLPTGPERTQGLIHTMGDACRQQGALLQTLLLFVHDQLSQGATVAQVFTQLFAKQRGMAPA